MPDIDELIELLDPADAYQLTHLIERRRAETTDYAVPFCPMFSFDDREVELFVRIGFGSGLAPFKADNASTPVAPASGDAQRQLIELVTISEKDVLKATDLISLESRDPRVRIRAVRDVVGKTLNLRIRNTNRTRWMAWYTAIYGQLPITYPNGATITVDWDFAGADMNAKVITSTHLPTADTAWNHTDDSDDYDAPVIEDVHTWVELMANDAGVDENQMIMHLNSTTFRFLKLNKAVRAELSTLSPRIITPTRAEIAEILGVADIKLINDFYWSTTSHQTRTKFIPNGKVLFTTPYEINSTPIAQMYDGLVARVSGDDIVVAPNPGLQADIYVDKEAVTKSTRVTSARMPILHHPEAFLTATVYE